MDVVILSTHNQYGLLTSSHIVLGVGVNVTVWWNAQPRLPASRHGCHDPV